MAIPSPALGPAGSMSTIGTNLVVFSLKCRTCFEEIGASRFVDADTTAVPATAPRTVQITAAARTLLRIGSSSLERAGTARDPQNLLPTGR